MATSVKIKNNGECREFYSARVAVAYLSIYLKTDINIGKLLREDEIIAERLLIDMAKKMTACSIISKIQTNDSIDKQYVINMSKVKEIGLSESAWNRDHLWSE